MSGRLTTPALVFKNFGPPAAVLAWSEIPLAPFRPDSVRVRLKASPVNPADLNYIEGVYGVKPELPAVGGLEGAGEVVEVGGAVTHLKPGALVSLPRGAGHWREEYVGPADSVSAFPPGLAAEQAALFRINPATAWCLLYEFVEPRRGDWIVQNAATSAVGCAVIVVARHLGLRTLNLVRRTEDVARLKAEGADAVIVADVSDKDSVREAVAAAERETGGAPVRLGLNAVGGESAALIARLLAPGGFHVTYGAMARQPVRISNRSLIFDDLAFRGFWVTRWRERAEPAKVAAMEEELADLFARGLLRAEVEKGYDLDQYTAAISHAERGARGGKVLFRIG